MAALATALGVAAPADATPDATARQQALLAAQQKQIATLVDAADRTCLSNVTTTKQSDLKFSLDGLVNGVRSALGLKQTSQVLRGAAATMPAKLAVVENDAIRTCMSPYVVQILAMVQDSYQQLSPDAAWPDPIDFRFKYGRKASHDSKLYSEFLRLDVQAHGREISRRLLMQDPTGEAYFDYDIAYPMPSETVRGVIAPELKGDASLTTHAPVLTDICFRRASSLPPPRSSDFDLFTCEEGKTCGPSPHGTGWLAACPASRPPVTHARADAPVLQRAAYVDGAETVPSAVPLHWTAPSLQALASRPSQGVGYTVFSIQTPAFQRPDVTAVEVDVRVNGVPVLEDGLSPQQRPVSNDPAVPFAYSFALQSLDFAGGDGGCDAVRVRLRPRLAQGEVGAPLDAALSYVALRDVAPRKADGFSWSAAYVVPSREWRNLAELHSYGYAASDGAARDAAAARAVADKRVLDGFGLRFEDAAVLGVVRPPRTVQPDGSAAFGLAAGLRQPNGQVRFTFSDADARRLAAFLIDHRKGSAAAARVIGAQPYIFQTAGGARSAPGICGVAAAAG